MDQKQYWIGDENKYQYRSIEKFAESFRSSYLPQLAEDNLCRSNNTGKGKEIKTSASRRISTWNTFKACFSREVLLMKRNSPLHIFKIVQITVLAFVISTVYIRTTMNQKSVLDANKYMGSLFIAVVIVNFNGMTEIAMTIKRLPTFYKQRELLALPGWALLSSVYLISLPMSLVETGLWTSLTYFVIGYAPSFVRYSSWSIQYLMITDHNTWVTENNYLALLQIHTALFGTFCHASNVNGPLSFLSSNRKNTSNGQHARHRSSYSNLHIWRLRHIKRLDVLAQNNVRCIQAL